MVIILSVIVRFTVYGYSFCIFRLVIDMCLSGAVSLLLIKGMNKNLATMVGLV